MPRVKIKHKFHGSAKTKFLEDVATFNLGICNIEQHKEALTITTLNDEETDKLLTNPVLDKLTEEGFTPITPPPSYQD